MDPSLLWRAALVQALLVAAVFAALVAAPLPEGFFEDYGAITGPLAWIGCSFTTGAILSVPTWRLVIAATAGGVAGAVVGVLIGHNAGLPVAIAVLAAVVARRARAPAQRRG